MRKRRALGIGAAVAVGLTVAGGLSHRADAEISPLSVASRPITTFCPGSQATRFGQLEFVGGLVLSPSSSHVSGLSGLRLSDGRSRLLAITDQGYWFAATIDRDAAGRPTGLSNSRLAPLLGANGKPLESKGKADAEGLAIDGDRILISFERDHRIAAYAPVENPFDSPARPVALPIPRKSLKSNKGIETIAVSPLASPLAGAAVIVAEHSLDNAGNHLAAIFGGAHAARVSGPFSVKRDDPWEVSDGAFLPDGDLLLLERRYSPLRGVGMRIRRIDAKTIVPKALVDGPVIVEADMSCQIDNMEGLDASLGSDGAIHLTLISDDNGSFLQRSLLLEFKLVESPTTVAN